MVGGEQPAVQEPGRFVVAMIVCVMGFTNVFVAYFRRHLNVTY
jgi:hypothetical protein